MESIVSAVLQTCLAGGVVYLIVEKLFSKRKDKADAQSVEISNGNEVAELYKKIDEIVQSKVSAETKRICDELKEVRNELKEIKSHWCCYRSSCEDRILYKEKAETFAKHKNSGVSIDDGS